MPGEEKSKRREAYIRQNQDADGKDEMPFPLRVLTGGLFVFAKDLQVTVFNDKDIMKEKGGQQVKGGRKKSGLSRGCKPGMSYNVQV